MKNILTLVSEAPQYSCIYVNDLVECCDSMEQLGKAILLAYKKGCIINSRKQRWFNEDFIHQYSSSTSILVLRLIQLQKQIDRNYRCI